MFGEVGFSRDVFGDVGIVSGHVRRGRICVGPYSARSAYCRDLSGDVGLISGCVLRGRLIGRDMSGEVAFVSIHVRRGLLSVGT